MTRRRWGRVLVAGVVASAVGPAATAGAPAPAPRPAAPVQADELILQFKRPELQAALLQAQGDAGARGTVQRALDALARRHGVALHYLQTLGVGSALVAMTPAAAQAAALQARLARLAADAEVQAVELNARMKHFQPGGR
ncbi:hypothetical protein EOE66_05420 [Rubrivivax rivuli]|uniref:Uncharacterized protein n=1 Tax=Rubrivivax rivuli TaxID=1862385 RepID=A0A437RKC4_9BURK|nr:hypothetical protein EOE66_05420 [Rubrivivax rivuli]